MLERVKEDADMEGRPLFAGVQPTAWETVQLDDEAERRTGQQADSFWSAMGFRRWRSSYPGFMWAWFFWGSGSDLPTDKEVFLIRASQSSIDALQFLASIRTSVIPAPRLVHMERARSCHMTLLPTWAVKVCRSIPQKPAFPTSYSLSRRLGQETLSRLLLRSGLDPTASSACKHLRWSSRGRPPVDRSRVFATPKKPFQGFCSGTVRDRTGPLASETKACKQRRWSSQGRPQVEQRGRRV